jgi:hypothetical protein
MLAANPHKLSVQMLRTGILLDGFSCPGPVSWLEYEQSTSRVPVAAEGVGPLAAGSVVNIVDAGGNWVARDGFFLGSPNFACTFVAHGATAYVARLEPS